MTKPKKRQSTPITDSLEYNIGGIGSEMWVVDAAHVRMLELKVQKLEAEVVRLGRKK